jgi:hypothetical protein
MLTPRAPARAVSGREHRVLQVSEVVQDSSTPRRPPAAITEPITPASIAKCTQSQVPMSAQMLTPTPQSSNSDPARPVGGLSGDFAEVKLSEQRGFELIAVPTRHRRPGTPQVAVSTQAAVDRPERRPQIVEKTTHHPRPRPAPVAAPPTW